jgi:DNA repair protein RecN (Recombination protein N)
MLIELQIHNFAIIDRLALLFGPGMNTLTGETGAGKSIIIDALGAVLGDRTGSDVVRTGANRAVVDATFDLGDLPSRDELVRTLDDQGIELEDGLLILSREIMAGGRSSARINGRQVTAAMLQRIGRLLVDIHGQSEHLSLLRPEQQLILLDRYAGTTGLRDEFAAIAGRIRDLRAQIHRLETGARDRAQRADLLAFQANEIASAALSVEEEESLLAERRLLESTERLVAESSEIMALLSGTEMDGEAPAIPTLRRALQLAQDLAQIDPELESLAQRLGEQLYLIEDVAAEVRAYRDTVEPDPGRLEIVEDRLDLIQRLKRKYGATIEEVIAFGDAAQQELEELTGGEGGVEGLRARLASLEDVAATTAQRLSDARSRAASTMSKAIESAISELRMGRASIAVQVTQRQDEQGLLMPDGTSRVAFDSNGVDHVEFLLAANLGEALKPLAKVASGGETARIMLAIKSILAAADATPTLVFDEVDSGVGGRSGQVVGEKLWSLTSSHQVIVITHLPQIAAFGDAHFRIAKRDQGGLTVTDVREIQGSERVIEIAEMIGGITTSDATRQSANELVEAAAAWKDSHRHRRAG